MGEGLGVLAVGLCALAAAVLAAALCVAAAADLAERIVPNGCVAAVAAARAGWLGAAALGGADIEEVVAEVASSVAGCAVVLAVMLGAATASRALCGSPGVGGGDVKLLAAAGLWCGPGLGLVVVAASCALSVAAWGAARAVRWVRVAAAGARAEAAGGGVPTGPGKPTGGGKPAGAGHAALSEGIPLAPGIALATLAVLVASGTLAA